MYSLVCLLNSLMPSSHVPNHRLPLLSSSMQSISFCELSCILNMPSGASSLPLSGLYLSSPSLVPTHIDPDLSVTIDHVAFSPSLYFSISMAFSVFFAGLYINMPCAIVPIHRLPSLSIYNAFTADVTSMPLVVLVFIFAKLSSVISILYSPASVPT